MLADEVGSVHAEVGDVRAHGYLAATVDALAHALVDLGDGRDQPTTSTPLTPLPGGPGEVVASSAAAAAATLRRVHAQVSAALAGPDGIPPGLAGRVLAVLADLAQTLQWLATTAGSADPDQQRARLHRDLLAAHRCLQPAGTVQG